MHQPPHFALVARISSRFGGGTSMTMRSLCLNFHHNSQAHLTCTQVPSPLTAPTRDQCGPWVVTRAGRPRNDIESLPLAHFAGSDHPHKQRPPATHAPHTIPPPRHRQHKQHNHNHNKTMVHEITSGAELRQTVGSPLPPSLSPFLTSTRPRQPKEGPHSRPPLPLFPPHPIPL